MTTTAAMVTVYQVLSTVSFVGLHPLILVAIVTPFCEIFRICLTSRELELIIVLSTSH